MKPKKHLEKVKTNSLFFLGNPYKRSAGFLKVEWRIRERGREGEGIEREYLFAFLATPLLHQKFLVTETYHFHVIATYSRQGFSRCA